MLRKDMNNSWGWCSLPSRTSTREHWVILELFTEKGLLALDLVSPSQLIAFFPPPMPALVF